MMHRGLLLLVLSMSVGCPGCTREEPPPRPSVPCTLVIQGTRIQYKGRELPLPGSLQSWEHVLGKPSRKVEVSTDVYVWDDVGVLGSAEASTTRIHALDVVLNPWSNPLISAPEYLPRKTFQGRLCVDGSDITPKSQIIDINRTKQGQLFSRGYLDSIYSYDVKGAPSRVYVRIDLTDERTPESFYIGFSETQP